APPGFSPRNTCPEHVTAPAPSRGSHLGLFNAAPPITSVRGPRSYVAIMDRFGLAETGVTGIGLKGRSSNRELQSALPPVAAQCQSGRMNAESVNEATGNEQTGGLVLNLECTLAA